MHALLEERPTALVATISGTYLDPLFNTKRVMPYDTDLVRLVNLPVDHWIVLMKQRTETIPLPANRADNSDCRKGVTFAASAIHSCMWRTGDEVTSSLSPPMSNRRSACTLEFCDLPDIANVKRIYLSIRKGRNRLAKEMLEVQKHVDDIIYPASLGTECFPKAARWQLESGQIKVMKQAHRAFLLAEIHDVKKLSQTQFVEKESMRQKLCSTAHQTECRVKMSAQGYRDETLTGLDIPLNAVEGGVHVSLKIFRDRARRMKVHEPPPPSADFADGREFRWIGDRSQFQSNATNIYSALKSGAEGKRPVAAIAHSHSSFTYRSVQTLSTSAVCDGGESEQRAMGLYSAKFSHPPTRSATFARDSMPRFYASPINRNDGVEDGNWPLLAGETFSRCPKQYPRPRYASFAGKLILLLQCKS